MSRSGVTRQVLYCGPLMTEESSQQRSEVVELPYSGGNKYVYVNGSLELLRRREAQYLRPG
jgi:hypothetical protein